MAVSESSSLLVRGLIKQIGGFTLKADLQVGVSERLAVTGPSGSGKTTFLRLLAGLELLRGAGDQGQILLEGRDITQLPPQKREIGFIFQDPALFPQLSVLENAAFGLRIRGAGKAERRSLTLPWLERVGLSSLADGSVQELSGGEKSRVAFIRALVWKPRLLLLDEPFSALDSALRQTLRDELLALHREAPMPLILVTHDREDVRAIATVQAQIQGGGGPVREIIRL